jgi:hypothetical protein
VEHFKVGDRVQARCTGVVLAGTHGTIRQITHSVPPAYVVWFDGWAKSRLMHACDLERAADERKHPPTA